MSRVLVVDDDNNIRLTVTKCLGDAGHNVDAAVDGHHALDKISENEYDVVLLDMKLPDIDGLEILRRAQGRPAAFVMITGYGTVETAVEAMKLGAVDYLRKPFTPDEIRAVVSAVAERFRTRAEDASRSFEECLEYAKRLITEQKWDDAYIYLRKAITMEPRKPEPYNLIGVMLEMQGDKTEALKMYRAALGVDPTYPPAKANLDRAVQFRYTREGIDMGARQQPKA